MAVARIRRSAAWALGALFLGCGAQQPQAAESAPPAPSAEKSDAPERADASTAPPGVPTDTKAETQSGDSRRQFAVGKARVSLGDVPPWELPTSVKLAGLTEPVGEVTDAGLSWRLRRTIRVGVGYLSFAELSPAAEQIFVLSDDDGLLRRYEAKTGKETGRYAMPGFARFDAVAFTLLPNFADDPAGPPLRALYSGPSSSGVLDLGAGSFDATRAGSTDLRSTSRPGLFGLTQHRIEPQSGSLELAWIPGPPSSDRAAQIEFVERPDNWTLSNDGRVMAVLYYPCDCIEVLDLETRSLRATLPAPKYARGLALSPDGRFLAVGGEELRVHDFESGELVSRDQSFGNNIHEVRFTPDGRLLLVSAYDGKARSFRFEAGKLGTKQLLVHGTANVYALGLDRSGRQLVTSSGDQTVKLWQR